MKGIWLSEFQVQKISDILRKYGIESPGLLEELTDHYSGEIEEKMEAGCSFEEAFDEFVGNNSWLKLRKLEHAYVEYRDKSLRRYIIARLKEVWMTPKIAVAIALTLGMFYLLKQGGDFRHYALASIHAVLLIQTLTLAILAILRFRKNKSPELGYVIQFGFAMFYLTLLPLWKLDHTVFRDIFEGVNDWALLTYYFFLFQLAYLHLAVYMRVDAWETRKEGFDY